MYVNAVSWAKLQFTKQFVYTVLTENFPFMYDVRWVLVGVFNHILAKKPKDSRIAWPLASHLAYFESFLLYSTLSYL